MIPQPHQPVNGLAVLLRQVTGVLVALGNRGVEECGAFRRVADVDLLCDECIDMFAQQLYHLELLRPAGLLYGGPISGPNRVHRLGGVTIESDMPSGDYFRHQRTGLEKPGTP